MGVESSEEDSDNAPAYRHEASRRRNTGRSSSDDEADDAGLVFSGAVGGSGKQLQSEESSAEHALDAVAQLTALVQVFISHAQRGFILVFLRTQKDNWRATLAASQAKSQEAERLRSHLEGLEQISECCICFDRPVSHAFM